jgi:hypothetical protein
VRAYSIINVNMVGATVGRTSDKVPVEAGGTITLAAYHKTSSTVKVGGTRHTTHFQFLRKVKVGYT